MPISAQVPIKNLRIPANGSLIVEAGATVDGVGGGGDSSDKLPLAGGTMDDGADIVFFNGSKLREGTTNAGLGGNKGIAQVCSIDYELKWEAGRLYVLQQDGFTIRVEQYGFSSVPTATDDATKGYVVGSRRILDNGDSYACTDSTTDAAVWSLEVPLVAGTDYQTPLVAGTDYLAPTGDGTGLTWDINNPLLSLRANLDNYYLATETDPVVGAISGLVKADGSGSISAAVAGTDYQIPLVAGTDYLAPTGDGSGLTELTISQLTDFPTIPDLSSYSSLFDGTGGYVASAESLGGGGLGAFEKSIGGTRWTVADTWGIEAAFFAGDGSGLSGVLTDATAFATAAQGALADSALQPDGDGSGVSFSDPASLISTLSPYFLNWGGFPFAGLVMGDGSGNSSAAVAGTDYLAPTGDGSGLTELTISQLTDFPTIPDLSGYSSLFDGTGGDVAYAVSAGQADTVSVINESGITPDGTLFATAAQGALADSSLQPTGDGSGLTFATPPPTAASTGSVGQIANDGTSLYLCTGTDTWVKADIATLGFATF